MKTHKKKTWPEFHQALITGEKKFELRKDDCNYEVGDYFISDEWDPANEWHTGSTIVFEIIYVLRDAQKFGLKKGYVILGLEFVDDAHFILEAWQLAGKQLVGNH